jgi:hypothetical protein
MALPNGYELTLALDTALPDLFYEIARVQRQVTQHRLTSSAIQSGKHADESAAPWCSRIT